MSCALSPSTNRSYGVAMVSRLWRTARATVYRQRSPATEHRRPGPLGPMPDDELVAAIRDLLAQGPFHGEGYRKIWARLRFAGIRTSRRRVLRLTRKHGLQAPGRVGRPHGPKAHDGTIRTERVDLMWGTDLSSTLTAEGQAAIFVAVDHCSAECIGIHAARRATPLRSPRAAPPGRAHLLRRLRRGRRCRPRAEARSRQPVRCRRLPARARLPRHRPIARLCSRARGQRLRRAVHPNAQGKPPVGPRFATVEELRQALHAFKDTYNRTWIVERHGYQTPAAVRAAQAAPLPAAA